MPISAPGSRKIPSLQRGFTLVELMVVIAILGLTAGAVVLAMPDPRGDLRVEAERLAARTAAARDAAVIEGRPYALLLDAGGYRFEARDRGGWRALTQRPLGPVRWPEGAGLVLGDQAPARVRFDPTGTAEPVTLALVRDGQRIAVRIGADGSAHVE